MWNKGNQKISFHFVLNQINYKNTYVISSLTLVSQIENNNIEQETTTEDRRTFRFLRIILVFASIYYATSSTHYSCSSISTCRCNISSPQGHVIYHESRGSKFIGQSWTSKLTILRSKRNKSSCILEDQVAYLSWRSDCLLSSGVSDLMINISPTVLKNMAST